MVNFSVVVIAKNEAHTLPRLVKSLEEFQKRGGVIVVLDTGSSDGTADIARKLGCKVEEVGERFVFKIDAVEANRINKMFVEKGEPEIVKAGDKFFNFSDARNHAASLSPTDIVSMPDCDEIFTALDIDYVEGLIKNGNTQFEFNFVFSHDQNGNELIKFLQCKMYDRRLMEWRGVIHECLFKK